MRIDRTKVLKSSFLSIEKDMGLIMQEILKNDRLKKLLFYTSPDALDPQKPKLTPEESLSLVGGSIKNIPKIYIDQGVLNYLIINFDNFTPNPTNPEFRDNIIEFDILCHFNQWQLKDFKLRPYRIAAEIDSMFDGKHLTGIGKLEFLGGTLIAQNDEFGGVALLYRAVHGEEDKWPLQPPLPDESKEDEYDEEDYWNEYRPGLK
jgi:hypothetical protein